MNQPILYQRIEGGFLFITSLYFYLHLGFSLWWFLIFLLSIDISMLGYVVNKTFGAHLYNIGHSLIVPSVLLIVGMMNGESVLFQIGLIWMAHIGMDRAFGYGLKFDTDFQDTHLGRIGRK